MSLYWFEGALHSSVSVMVGAGPQVALSLTRGTTAVSSACIAFLKYAVILHNSRFSWAYHSRCSPLSPFCDIHGIFFPPMSHLS